MGAGYVLGVNRHNKLRSDLGIAREILLGFNIGCVGSALVRAGYLSE